MTPLGLTDQQLKTVLDVAGFVPRRLRRKFLKDMAAQLPVVPGTKKTLSTLRDSDVERAISDVLVNLDRVESGRRAGASGPEGKVPARSPPRARTEAMGLHDPNLVANNVRFRG